MDHTDALRALPATSPHGGTDSRQGRCPACAVAFIWRRQHGATAGAACPRCGAVLVRTTAQSSLPWEPLLDGPPRAEPCQECKGQGLLRRKPCGACHGRGLLPVDPREDPADFPAALDPREAQGMDPRDAHRTIACPDCRTGWVLRKHRRVRCATCQGTGALVLAQATPQQLLDVIRHGWTPDAMDAGDEMERRDRAAVP